MAILTVQESDFEGITPSFAAASASGDEFVNDGRTFLYVKNGATAVNITVTAQETTISKSGFGEVAISSTTVAVADSAEAVIGPFPTARFNDKTTGRVEISYDDESNVTVAAIKLARS